MTRPRRGDNGPKELPGPKYHPPVSLPARVTEVLAAWGVPTDVRARLAELHRFIGPAAIDAFVGIAESSSRAPSELLPQDLDPIRADAGESYLSHNHPLWLQGEPTPGFWRDRTLEGGASGLVTPLANLEAPHDDLGRVVASAYAAATGPDQPPPRGILLLSRNTHFGNRPGEFSVDLVPSDLDEARAVNRGLGQQHTIPGSIGEASGTAWGEPPLAVAWEIQPNIYKPSAERNREANAAWRRHRNWHLATAIGAFAWLRHGGWRSHVLRSEALHLAHEVNPDKPLSDDIRALHDRTVNAALHALGLSRAPVDPRDGDALARLLDEALSQDRGGAPAGELVDRVA
jgi:hypothetical protein